MSELGLRGSAGPSADLLADCLRVLLWLCSEQAPAPQSVQTTPQRAVLFGWRLGGTEFQVEAQAPGRAVWRTVVPGEEPRAGVLDSGAVRLLRSLIPMSRHRPTGPLRGTHATDRAGKKPGRGGRQPK